MEGLIKLSGGILIGLALFHAFFPGYFKWRDELRSITLLTRQVHYIHTFFIALTILLIGLLCLGNAPELVHTPFGRKVSAGIFIFWSCRLVLQFCGFSPSLWKGKPFETAMHVLFSTLWVFLASVFGAAAFAPNAAH